MKASDGEFAKTVLAIDGAMALLPLPNSLAYQSEYKWEVVELGQAGFMMDEWTGDMEGLATIMKNSPEAFKRAFAQTDNAVSNAVSNMQQKAPNPKEAINFKGVTFREYELEFTITGPDSASVKKKMDFINQLHQKAAPSLDSTKYFWEYPPSGIFWVIYGSGYLFPPREIYIKSIGTDLNAGGDNFFPGYAGGLPVQSTLTIGVIEKALPSKANDANLMKF